MTEAPGILARGRAAPGRMRLLWVLLAVSLVACTGTEPTTAPSHPVTPTAEAAEASPATHPSPSAGSWTAPDRFTALWPETAASEVPAELAPWRRSAEETVHRFAMSVLEWDDPQVESMDSRFNTESGTEVFTVSRGKGTPAIEVHAKRMIDAEHWSVTYLWGFGDREPPASVSITSERAYVGFGYWDDAASAQLLLRYGRHQVERTSTDEARWEIPLSFPLEVTGAVIVLFRDAEDHVYTGWGTALPAGDFHAG